MFEGLNGVPVQKSENPHPGMNELNLVEICGSESMLNPDTDQASAARNEFKLSSIYDHKAETEEQTVNRIAEQILWQIDKHRRGEDISPEFIELVEPWLNMLIKLDDQTQKGSVRKAYLHSRGIQADLFDNNSAKLVDQDYDRIKKNGVSDGADILAVIMKYRVQCDYQHNQYCPVDEIHRDAAYQNARDLLGIDDLDK